jgi:Initiator Replication protein, WH1/Initiator Rep protein, WH2
MIKKSKTLELKKHVATIHSGSRLSLLQRKIANALLYNAYDELLKKNEHQIHVKELCQLIGYDSHDHKLIKQALVSLISTVVEWNLVDKNKIDDAGVWNASSIIADASIAGPICTYSYSNRMRELLHHPAVYGRLNMHIQAKFKSTYGLALYENCIRYQNIRQTPWLDLSTFRLLMGVQKDKYSIFRDLKHTVINKAISEVNQYSPIMLEAEYQKKSRQVVSIRFLIIKKTRKEVTVTENAPGLMIKLCSDFGFSSSLATKVLNQFEEAYILEKINIVENSNSFCSGKIANLAQYLQKALNEDYQPPKSSYDRLTQEKKVKEKQAKEESLKVAQRDDFFRAQNQQIFEACNSLEPNKQKQILIEFQEFLSKTVYQSIYQKEGLANFLVLDKFGEFVRKYKPDLLAGLLTFEEYFAANAQEE